MKENLKSIALHRFPSRVREEAIPVPSIPWVATHKDIGADVSRCYALPLVDALKHNHKGISSPGGGLVRLQGQARDAGISDVSRSIKIL